MNPSRVGTDSDAGSNQRVLSKLLLQCGAVEGWKPRLSFHGFASPPSPNVGSAHESHCEACLLWSSSHPSVTNDRKSSPNWLKTKKKKKNRKQWTVLAQGTEESKVLAPGITWACLSVSFSSLPRGRGNIISSPPTTERECLPPHPSPREVSRESPLA